MAICSPRLLISMPWLAVYWMSSCPGWALPLHSCKLAFPSLLHELLIGLSSSSSFVFYCQIWAKCSMSELKHLDTTPASNKLQCVVGDIRLWSDQCGWLSPSAVWGSISPRSLQFLRYIERSLCRRRGLLKGKCRGEVNEGMLND